MERERDGSEAESGRDEQEGPEGSPAAPSGDDSQGEGSAGEEIYVGEPAGGPEPCTATDAMATVAGG